MQPEDPTQHSRLRHVPVDGHKGFYWKDSRKLEVGFRYRDSDGSRQYAYGSQPQFGRQPWTLREAKKEQARLDVAVDRQEIVVSAKAPTFEQVREEWVAARKIGERTAEARDANLKHYCQTFERKKLRDINDKRVILTWLNGLRSVKTGGPLNDGTKAQILAALRDVLRYGVKQGYVPRNAANDLDRDDRPRQGGGHKRILTHDEEDRLLLYCANFPWMRPIITVARAQALRLGEIRGLQWSDVDFANNKLRVHQQLRRDGTLGPTKGARNGKRDKRDLNHIDLMPEAREALLELRMASDGTGYVFRNTLWKSRGQSDIEKSFGKAVKKAVLLETADGKVTFHSLRHTGISRLANYPQIPLVYVRDFAGHASLSTTETYVHKIEQPSVTAAAAEAMAGER